MTNVLLADLASHFAAPSRRTIAFAIKGVTAASLAVAVSLYFDLDKPFWAAVASMMLQARPETGLVVEKAGFLVLGTLLGAAISAYITSNYLHDPLAALILMGLLLAATSLIAGTVRHVNFVYAATLISVTALIIILFSVADISAATPLGIFGIIRTRVLEVIVGATAATATSLLVFPWRLDGVLRSHVQSLMNAVARYSAICMDPSTPGEQHQKLAHGVLAQAAVISDDSNAGRYEQARSVKGSLYLASRAVSLVGDLRGIHSVLERFCAAEATLALLSSTKDALERLSHGASGTCWGDLRHLRAQVTRLRRETPVVSTTDIALLNSLDSVLRMLSRMNRVQQAIQKGGAIRVHVPRFRSHRDPIVGAAVATRTLLAFVASTWLWIFSGGQAPLVMMMVLPALFGQLFSGAPMPAVVVRKILLGSVLALITSVAVALPMAALASGHVELLLMTLAAPLFLGLMSMTHPVAMPVGLGFCFVFVVLVQPSNHMTFSIEQTVITGVGIVAGISLLYFSSELLPRPSGTFLQRRLLKSIAEDLRNTGTSKRARRHFNQRFAEKAVYLSAREIDSDLSRQLTANGLAGLELARASIGLHRRLLANDQAQSDERLALLALWREALHDAFVAALSGRRDLGLHFASQALTRHVENCKLSRSRVASVQATVFRVQACLSSLQEANHRHSAFDLSEQLTTET
ncbi:FUSC family protein [Stenotrophomonas maltophilia]|uniref:FUSC family protein n=1 Tax=Stenotrophomonas maltophilia TaxID=40324 RepID=A0A246IDB4_STEMA|nr:FUSC family protein [Stenotrophomonas maltophilia]OWQ78020.1 hypothetical protein CEE63_03150 [Stenotrophomonas maltophilia]